MVWDDNDVTLRVFKGIVTAFAALPLKARYFRHLFNVL
jgi:hypothetical protein